MEQDQKFDLGEVYVSRDVHDLVGPAQVARALSLHAQGDWGMVDPEDWKSNELALENGARLLSVYESEDGEKFWIITEADRSATTVFFPDDY